MNGQRDVSLVSRNPAVSPKNGNLRLDEAERQDRPAPNDTIRSASYTFSIGGFPSRGECHQQRKIVRPIAAQ